MGQKKLSAITVAMAYIGTVVGAGFASGQEVLQFFGFFGFWGLAGLMLAMVLFSYFGYLILKLGDELDADSHLPIIKHAGGKWIGGIIDYVIIFFLFGALAVMGAGAGALFSEQFGLPNFLGSVILIGVSLFTVLLGLNGVISAISIVVPILLVSVVGIAIYTLTAAGLPAGASALAIRAGNPAVPFWPLAALVYVSYNLVLAVAVLGPMGKEAAILKTLKKGALWGGLGLGLGAVVILLAIFARMPQATGFELPMIYVAGQIAPAVRIFYAIVLFSEIYTTAVGSLYGFVARFSPPASRKMKILAIGTSGIALAAAQLGFTTLVRVLFPLVGYAGILMLGGLVYREIQPYLKTGFTLIPRPALKREIKQSNKEKVKEKDT
ncbi:MAG: hypothetical protein PHT78_00090 [Desulfitobacteriaceae bacterium]|nr:hypothetical protein [Desulfitobacteriaceae bacterium]